MKTLQVIIKSLKEQMRSYWILLLILLMGPFFIFVYYLIIETSKPHYNILVVNHDKNIYDEGKPINFGDSLIAFFNNTEDNSNLFPVTVTGTKNYENSVNLVKNKKADALLLIDSSFSQTMIRQAQGDSAAICHVEFSGDLTNSSYLISSVWANEITTRYVSLATGKNRLIEVSEKALGASGNLNDFDMIVPGILILSLIMLMFTASIAFVEETEHKTILRLKLSGISTIEFLGGVTVVQLIIGIASIFLTLLTAIALGFDFSGSLLTMTLVACITSLSIIAFSLIIAAFTRSANEVLVAGNFPMFLFMFFTGAAFPLKSKALFTIAGYPVTIQGLMSPTHAISALNKTLVMDMNVKSIIPEITAILILTVLYFLIGAFAFQRRHLKLGLML